MHSLICFLNGFINKYYVDYQQYLKDNFQNINFITLKTENFNDLTQAIKNSMIDNKKICVLTTYSTVGVGQNIQYEFLPKIEQNLIKTSNRNKTKEKDFDAIYIDLPTYIIPNIYNNSDNNYNNALYNVNDKLKNAKKTIYFLESLRECKEINQHQFYMGIRDIFKYLSNYLRYKSKNIEIIRMLDPYSLAGLTKIIQAIGRLNRADYKNKEMLIYFDDKICFDTKHFRQYQIFLTPLEERFLLALDSKNEANKNKYEVDKLKINKSKNEIEQKCIKNYLFVNYIKNKMYESKEIFQVWQLFGEFVMKFPSIDDINDSNIIEFKQQCRKTLEKIENFSNNSIENLFKIFDDIFIPEYNYYVQEKDYKNVTILYGEHNNHHKYNIRDISKENDYLFKMFYIESILNYFKAHNFKTFWNNSKLMISPIIHNNIYKGRFGEICGKIILNNYGIKLKPLENNFELFDFQLQNAEGVYIDFKCWNEKVFDCTNEQKNEYIEKINKKIYALGKSGNKVNKILIINIMSELYPANEKRYEYYNVENNEIIGVVPCLCNFYKFNKKEHNQPEYSKHNINYIFDIMKKYE